MEPGAFVGIVAILAVFGIPLSAIWTHHQRELAKIKAQKPDPASPDVIREIQGLRQDMAMLRDTTTKFDMSFDAALSRLEQRMDKAETNIHEMTPVSRNSVAAPAETENTAVLRVGKG